MTGGDYRRSELHSVIEVTQNRHRPPRLLTGYHFFSLAYQTLITIFGSPTFIYSRHGFYKYILFSFFHLFLRKSVGKGTEKYFPLTLMSLTWSHTRCPIGLVADDSYLGIRHYMVTDPTTDDGRLQTVPFSTTVLMLLVLLFTSFS